MFMISLRCSGTRKNLRESWKLHLLFMFLSWWCRRLQCQLRSESEHTDRTHWESWGNTKSISPGEFYRRKGRSLWRQPTASASHYCFWISSAGIPIIGSISKGVKKRIIYTSSRLPTLQSLKKDSELHRIQSYKSSLMIKLFCLTTQMLFSIVEMLFSQNMKCDILSLQMLYCF